MKNLKTICILFLSVLIISCSKDDGGGGEGAGTPEFKATINGGTFTNYNFILDYYDVVPFGGALTIEAFETNTNKVRLFLNSTGGLGGGIVKQIGDVDDDGFVTSALIRDQTAQITYTATSGSITITNNREKPDEPELRLITGSFNFEAISGPDTVIATGTFKDLEFFSE